MRIRLPLVLLRLCALVGLAVSTALLLDYLRPVAAFCAAGSGCEKVRLSTYAALFNIPVPIYGIAGFAGLFVLSFVASLWFVRLAAILGGVAGVGFILIQAVEIHSYCELCLVVDSVSIGAAVAALFLRPFARPSGRALAVWAAAGVLSGVYPLARTLVEPSPPVPLQIAKFWVPGKINVVEFTDFECPFCRKLHPDLVNLCNQYGDRVNFVRLNMPLASHAHARNAARAYCCAEDQGKGHAMADALFSANELTPEACERAASSVGLSLGEYRACVTAARTDQRIDSEIQRVRAAGLKGLPTVWVGERMLVGLQPVDHLRTAFEAAAGGTRSLRIPLSWFWACFGAALFLLAAASVRMERSEQAAKQGTDRLPRPNA